MPAIPLAASQEETPPIATYSRSAGGLHRRQVVRSNGKIVTTTMGRTTPRPNESIDASADRAYLLADKRPEHPDGSRVRVADVYSGCGGLSLGAWEACRALGRRFEAAAAFDSDEAALAIYKANFSPKHTYDDDVRGLVRGRLWEKLFPHERDLRKKVGDVDLLLAGPPCQGFTALNHVTRGDDERNHLYARVARFARLLEPSHIIIENLSSVRRDTEQVVTRTLNELERLGYEVAEHVIALTDIGVPQRRRRHVVVATTRDDLDLPALFADFAAEERDLRWAIRDLWGVASDETFDTASAPSPKNEKRMKYLRDHDLRDLPNAKRPECHRDRDHSYVSMYGRLRWDAPAQTITSGYGSMGQGRYVHPAGRRTLTPHEAARLQFFPDWFDFGDRTRSEYANVIGNAVPMKLSYVIALWLLR